MKTKIMLRVAMGLVLFTLIGHTVGTFMKVPAEQTEVAKTVEIMKTTLVPMPVGSPKSYSEIFLGTNLTVSLFLFVSGICFWISSSEGGLDGKGKVFLAVNSFGAAMLSLISFLYFFPLPAICTGIAAVLGFLVYSKKQETAR
ncbi:MAG TPA: hypothetical protein PKK94_06105 [Leptospiraceae bacterium]|nr:hypothetical protein [Leptospiraceae bacterium]